MSRRRIGRVKKLLIGVLALPILAFGVAYGLTYLDRFEDVPDAAWRTGDLSVIMERPAVATRAATDSAFADVVGVNTDLTAVPSSPPSLTTGAATWVQSINDANPEAILYHETDPLANLYVVFGGWWGQLTPDEQVEALDALGVAWRHYLRANFGEWDSRDGFAPGIVVFDSDGEVARNLNGQITIHRLPTY